jgi:hypothetical protein
MDSTINFLFSAFASYALAFLIASSSLFEPVRLWVAQRTPKLRIGTNKHFVYCRMCVGFWTSLVVVLCNNSLTVHTFTDILAVWGASYFLATQERR